MSCTTRRRLLAALGSAAALSGCAGLLEPARGFLGHGKARRPPVGTRGFVRRQFDGLTRSRVWDVHAHLIGLGVGGTGAWVNEAYREELYKSALFELYMLAAGVDDLSRADEAYVQRVLMMQHLMNPEGAIVLVGFDARVDERGEEVPEHSEIFTPNEYVYRVAERFGQVRAGASIHPYRKDALDRLDEAKGRGAVCVKWLPNTHAIDPASPKVDAFYKRMAEHGLVLLTHAGAEYAVDSAETQSYGNVLKLRRALDHGVKVIVAHAAGLGSGADLDEGEAERREMASFDLFLRLMGEKQYEDTLVADISAMTQVNRSGRPLRELMKLEELHPRLCNGSDYPLPAINPLVSTRWLERQGYLSHSDRLACNEVFAANPLLFDFVVKRCLRYRESGREHRFSDCVFETRWVFEGHTAKTRPLPVAA